MRKGKIIKGIGGFYYVDVEEEGIYECRARGKFRKQQIMPLVGDEVEISIRDEEKQIGYVESIGERKNELIRPTVSNVDQAIIVFAVKNPQPHYSLLDRFLILAEEQQIDVSICFNKVDLMAMDEVEQIISNYHMIGYDIMVTSAIQDEGSEILINKLKGKTTVFAGPSGVGKSSILNMVQPHLELKTGEISKKIKRGKHTTRHAELLPLDFGGYVVDTPGFSSLTLNHLSLEDLTTYYKEFQQYESGCKYSGCTHIHEPVCGVKQALEEDKISQLRYDNYIQLYNEIKDNQQVNKWR